MATKRRSRLTLLRYAVSTFLTIWLLFGGVGCASASSGDAESSQAQTYSPAPEQTRPQPKTVDGVERLPAQLVRVIDGDTIVVLCYIDGREQEERVRFIGIDCPEVRRGQRIERQASEFGSSVDELLELGYAATDYVRDRLKDGELRLELDVQSRDRYGRLLAYIWVDGVHLNRELVEKGLAVVSTYPPNVKYQEQYLEAQRAARVIGAGFWRE